MGVERLCEGTTMQIPFNADEIDLIYQFGEQSKTDSTTGNKTGLSGGRKKFNENLIEIRV